MVIKLLNLLTKTAFVYVQVVRKLYPHEDVGPTVDIQLKNKQIHLKLSATVKINGWNCELHQQKVYETAVIF